MGTVCAQKKTTASREGTGRQFPVQPPPPNLFETSIYDLRNAAASSRRLLLLLCVTLWLWVLKMMARSTIARCGIAMAILAVRARGEVVEITGEV